MFHLEKDDDEKPILKRENKEVADKSEDIEMEPADIGDENESGRIVNF